MEVTDYFMIITIRTGAKILRSKTYFFNQRGKVFEETHFPPKAGHLDNLVRHICLHIIPFYLHNHKFSLVQHQTKVNTWIPFFLSPAPVWAGNNRLFALPGPTRQKPFSKEPLEPVEDPEKVSWQLIFYFSSPFRSLHPLLLLLRLPLLFREPQIFDNVKVFSFFFLARQ